MTNLDIEFKYSSTGMYSPWHLDIAHKHNVNLMVTCDIGHFVKIGEDIYKIIRPYDAYRLYDYLKTLEEWNEKGDITDEEVLKEVDDIVNNSKKDITLEKQIPLEDWEKRIEKLKTK